MIQQNLEERRKRKLQASGGSTETRNDEAFKTSTIETGKYVKNYLINERKSFLGFKTR